MITPREMPAAGFLFGAVALATNTLLTYALVPFLCEHQARLGISLVAAALVLFSLTGVHVSYRAASSVWRSDARGGRPHTLLAVLGVTAGLLFALTIVMQAAAGFSLNGCER